MQAIILAGGKGTRLKPFTTNFPKPLVPIGDVPILEIVLKQLKYFGFTDIVLAVNHHAELIMAFFGKGEKLGLNIQYSIEDSPLGTAGPLSQIQDLDEDFLILNGDLLTTLDYNKLFRSHIQNQNDITITTYQKKVKIDLGVLETDNEKFIDYIEKPEYSFTVSTGIYVANRNIIEIIPKGIKYDMPELILKLKSQQKKIVCYNDDFYWLDIGRVEDYEKAQEEFELRKTEFLK